MFKLDSEKQMGKELRAVVVDTLKELMDSDETIIALDADLGGASGFNNFKKDHSNQFINVGIAEANMIGVSAGLSLMGYKPFVHTFGPFATRRVYDQLYISGAYAGKSINIYGSDPGFAAGANGGTHTTLEDVALMRAIPHSIVCDAADATQMEWIIKEFREMTGINYVRGNRKAVKNVYETGSTFELGKANVLKKGADLLLIATGQLISETLEVAERLEEQGHSVTVIDMFTVKPIDREAIKQHASDKKLIVTVENHSITGGLGSAVSEVLSEEAICVPLKRIGVDERFGEVGSPEYLQKAYGLSAERILEQINSKI